MRKYFIIKNLKNIKIKFKDLITRFNNKKNKY